MFELSFSLPGTYHFKDVKIYALDADAEEDRKLAEEKRENQLNLSLFENDHVKGHIQQETSSLLVTSIPYTSGWSVEVNGKDTPSVIVNSGFVGVPLPKGKSVVSLSYRTPYLTIGLLSTGLGLLLFAVNKWKWGGKKRRIDHERKD